MAMNVMKKPPLLSHYIKRTEETPNNKIQLTITSSKFYQTEHTQSLFLLKLLTFPLSHNNVELLLSKIAGKHSSHSDLSSLPCQTLFITLNITEYPTGPFALAQHSASATQYTSKSPLFVFLQERS